MNNLNLLKVLTEIRLKQENSCIRVEGRSMLPLIQEGDTVKIEKAVDYKAGDIVVAIDTQGRLLVHRIMRIKNGQMHIKGDNAVAIEVVDLDKCFGRVVEINTESGIININKFRFVHRVVSVLSGKMNVRWKKTGDYEGTIKGWQYRIINFINRRLK